MAILIVLIYWNYYSNTGNINGNTVGSLSDKYDSLFTPTGFTFAIWGIIYLMLLYLGIYMVRDAFSLNRDNNYILKIAPWIIVAHILNGIWLWFWLNESIGLCAIIISLIFVTLLICIFKANMQKTDPPLSFIAGVWWPIDLYAGWLAVASIANIASFLNTTEWGRQQDEIMWTIILLIIATFVNSMMIFARNMREFALVGIWAFIGISARHWGHLPSIQYAALLCAGILFFFIGIHAYQHRKTLPFIRRKFE